jgi:hypothetical protein
MAGVFHQHAASRFGPSQARAAPPQGGRYVGRGAFRLNSRPYNNTYSIRRWASIGYFVETNSFAKT